MYDYASLPQFDLKLFSAQYSHILWRRVGANGMMFQVGHLLKLGPGNVRKEVEDVGRRAM